MQCFILSRSLRFYLDFLYRENIMLLKFQDLNNNCICIIIDYQIIENETMCNLLYKFLLINLHANISKVNMIIRTNA